jgi:potassium-transporting ATPase KdpC subunit
MFTRYLRPALSLLLAMTVVTGMIYPLIITGASRVAFASKAEGSLLRRKGILIGSELIGQNFTDPKYFWGRPSATAPQPYNATSSGGSNLGPLNPALIDKVRANAKALRDADPANTAEIPVELVTASTSGLDPDISPAAANYQVARVARARQIPVAAVRSMLAAHQQEPLLGVFGEARINVLELNLALDQHH